MENKGIINFIKLGIFAALLTPLIKHAEFYFPYVGPKSIYFMALAELVFFAWVILAWRWKQYRPDLKNPLVIAILASLAVSFASAAAGANFLVSFWSKFERMGGILMFFHLVAFTLAAASVMERTDWRRFFYATVAIASYVALAAFFDKSNGANEGGLIGNNSFWGTYILFNIFFALYLFVSAPRHDYKTKGFAAAAFMAMAASLMLVGTRYLAYMAGLGEAPAASLLADIFGTGARAAKLSLVGGMLLFSLLWFSFSKSRAVKLASRLLLVAATSCGVVLVAMALQPGSQVYRFAVEKFNQSTVQGRLVVWEIGWKGFVERPLLGWGPENFNLVFARYFNPCIGSPECTGEIWFDRAHNVVVDTLVETGAIGLAAYLAIFAAALWLLWQPVFKNGQGLAEASVITALFAAYFVQNLTVFDMVVSYLMFFICLAFIISRGAEKPAAKYAAPLPVVSKMAIAAAGMLCFYFFVVGPFRTDYGAVAAAKAVYGSDQRIELSRKALAASPVGRDQIRNFLAKQWIVAMQNEKVLKILTVGAAAKNFTYLAQELEKSRAESPLDLQVRLRLAELYNSWGLIDQKKLILAEEVLSEAHDLSPQNQQYYLELAQTRIEQARLEDAHSLIKQAKDIYSANPNVNASLEKIEKIIDTASAAKTPKQ